MTLEELNPEFSQAKYFSKLDAKAGYWSVHLDDESQELTAFRTPFGRYCFCCLPFVSEVSGCVGIADDHCLRSDSTRAWQEPAKPHGDCKKRRLCVMQQWKMPYQDKPDKFLWVHPTVAYAQTLQKLKTYMPCQHHRTRRTCRDFWASWTSNHLVFQTAQTKLLPWGTCSVKMFHSCGRMIIKHHSKHQIVSEILWPHSGNHPWGWCIPERSWCLFTTDRKVDRWHLHQKPCHRRKQLLEHWKGSSCSCFWHDQIPHIPIWLQISSPYWSQATSDNMEQANR